MEVSFFKKVQCTLIFFLDKETGSEAARFVLSVQEHHLQRAISAQQVYGDTQQLVIPTPDTEEIKDKVVEFLYHDPFKQPKQYIHVQGLFA